MGDKFVHIKLTSAPAALVISDYGGELDGYEVRSYTGEPITIERNGNLYIYRLSADGSEYETATIEPKPEPEPEEILSEETGVS